MACRAGLPATALLLFVMLPSALAQTSSRAPAAEGGPTGALSTAAWLHQNGHHDAAQLTLRHYLDGDPASLPVRLEYARMLAFAQKYSEALREFQRVLQAEPGNLSAQAGVARVHAWQGRYPEALALYDQVLAREPGHYDATVGKAFTLLWMGRRSEATPLFQEAARRNPEDAEVAAVITSMNLRGGSSPAGGLSGALADLSPADRSLLQAAVAPAAGILLLGGALLAWRRMRSHGSLRGRYPEMQLPGEAALRLGRIPQPPPLPPQTLRGGDFLIVERDPETVGLMHMVLTDCGARVAACGSGEEAARLLAARDFDVLLLDAGLEGPWSAAELCAWLKRSPGQGARALILMAEPSRAGQLPAPAGAITLARPFSAHDLEVMARLALAHSRGVAAAMPVPASA